MDDVLDRLLAHWRKTGERPAHSTATAEEVAAWEANYGVRLSDELRAYVTRVNGILHGEALDFDNNLNTLLPLCAMRPESEWSSHEPTSKQFVIADHCIQCFWWTVELDAEPRSTSSVYLGGTSTGRKELIASSLSEFLDMYIADSPYLYR